MDFRKEWFKDRILEFFEETNPEIFYIFLRRGNELVENQLSQFLDNGGDNAIADISRQVFIVYKTYYSKIVQEEIEVQEEVLKQRTSSFLSQDEKKDRKGRRKKKGKKIKETKEEDEEAEDHVKAYDDVTSALEAPAGPEECEDDNKQTKKKKSKHGKLSGRISPYTMMENLPSEEQGKLRTTVSYVTVKKKIEKVTQVPQFQGYFGLIDGDNLDPANFYVYFIKKLIGKVPMFNNMQEANLKMPYFFVVGSLTGNILQNMENILELVFVPLFRNKILNPIDSVDKRNSDIDRHHGDMQLRRRPSYYYLKKHTNSFNLVKDELTIHTDNASFRSQISNFINPEEDQGYQELHERLISLVDVIKWAQTELTAERKFLVPQVLLELEWENLEINDDIVENAKSSIVSWIRKIHAEYENVLFYDHENQSLLEEYAYWREMEINLSTVVDEVNSPLTNKIISLIKETNTTLYNEFEQERANLYKQYESIKENADVLQTLQSFFETFMCGKFDEISNITPTLMDSLQSVWILSEYYRVEKNMERILIDIKNTLCYRVKSSFDVTNIFKYSWHDVKDDLENAISMLQSWKYSYLKVRARIESTKDYFISRWEFEKQKLFAATDYISTVIEDIKNIFEIVQSYRILFDSKFQCLTENMKEFQNLKETCAGLTIPIEKVDFDIYLEIFRDEWQEILEIFQQDVIDVDQRLKILIIKTFSQFKSIKEAIQVVQNLSEIQTRPTVHESIPYICNKIVAFFIREIHVTENNFEQNKLRSASINICDSIVWINCLIGSFQDIISCLEKVDSVTSLSTFAEALHLFKSFKTKAQGYIEVIFKEWCSISVSIIKETLSENIITIEEAEKLVDLINLSERKPTGALQLCKTSEDPILNDENSQSTENITQVNMNESLGFGALSMTLKWIARSRIMVQTFLRKHKLEVQKQIELSHKASWMEFTKNSLLIEKGFRFKIKFQDNIFDIMKEAENLKNENFKFPNEVHKLLAHESYLIRNTENIKNNLLKYNDIVRRLKPAEILLLKSYLLEVEMAIQPGLTLYTWKCTILENYVENVSTKLEQFSCLLYQINEIFKKLDTFVNSIEHLHFLPVGKIIDKNIPCGEFFHQIDNLQSLEVEQCLSIYNAISLTLIQLESLTLYTNTGRSELMTYYYITYRNKIISALIKSVSNSLFDFHLLSCGKIPAVFFHMRAFLENGEIKLDPSCDELYGYVKTILNRMLSRLKRLREWHSGSCISGKNSAEVIYNKLIQDGGIKSRCELLLESVKNLCDSLTTAKRKWLKFSILWKHDILLTIRQFASQEPDLMEYEIRFDFYSNISSKIEEENVIVNILCVNIEFEKLVCQLKAHCLEWKRALGDQLTSYTRETVQNLAETVKKLSISLNRNIKNDDDLTQVLRTVIEIQDIAGDMELKFYKIEEHYHELVKQNFQESEADKRDFRQLITNWRQLHDQSLFKKFSLEAIKNSMTDRMKPRINQFLKECENFAIEYEKEKENFASAEFDECVKLIQNYSERCEGLYTKKKELETIQKCYEIPPFDFKYFITIRNDLKTLRVEYKLTH